MSTRRLRVAILSDLHCHPKRDVAKEGIDCTYLLSDKLRSPINDHPVESLANIINENDIKVDLTLCPGDFTDKANIQGFIAGWNFSLEIHRKLEATDIIATLGNHDVDVYNNYSNYSLNTAKGIKQGFPMSNNAECDVFWSKGGGFVEKEDYRVLVINSSHFHYNKIASKHGEVGDDLIDYITSYLKDKDDNKIQIAMSHHHPIDHSGLQLGEEDKIVNSDALLNTLGECKFDLFIHGHKHHPLLRYHNTTKSNYRLPIFSSGSFSSSSNLMFTSVRNFFHILDLTKDKLLQGEIKTWTFFPHVGWKLNHDESSFAIYSGFGNNKTVEELLEEIKTAMQDKSFLKWKDVTNKIKDINYLIPTDSKRLYENLLDSGYKLSDHIWSNPQEIFNLNNLRNEN